jgi:hypothetical protein
MRTGLVTDGLTELPFEELLTMAAEPGIAMSAEFVISYVGNGCSECERSSGL